MEARINQLEKKIHTVAAGAMSERSSSTDFVVEMIGRAEDELAASVPAE